MGVCGPCTFMRLLEKRTEVHTSISSGAESSCFSISGDYICSARMPFSGPNLELIVSLFDLRRLHLQRPDAFFRAQFSEGVCSCPHAGHAWRVCGPCISSGVESFRFFILLFDICA